MIKKLFAAILALLAAAAFAAVDVNKATQADLESIKGIGPVIATKILDERKKASFKDWDDMVTRVKGVGEHNAAKFSADGLTVNGAAYAGAPAAAKKEGKSTMKAASKPNEPVTPAPAADAARTAAPTDATRKAQAKERAAARAAEDAEIAKQKAKEKADEKAAKKAKAASEATGAKAAASAPTAKK